MSLSSADAACFKLDADTYVEERAAAAFSERDAHSGQEEPAHGGDDQNPTSGVFGNAVWSMGDPEVTVRSTMESNSLSVGRRKPEPADEQ
jgi:hypothetical protein